MKRFLLPLFILAFGTSSARAQFSYVQWDENQPLARKCLDLALLCLASYDSDGDAEVLGWDGPDNHYGGYNLNDDFLSLHAAVYKRTNANSGEREAVMTFRGTDQTYDWVTNLQNFVGLIPDAYAEAATFAQAASALAEKEETEKKIDSFSFTGHSLGGGFASYCALLFSRNATCFGSAAVGKGLQKIIWDETSGRSIDPASLVLHVIKKDDLVPVTTEITGKQYGTIVFPKLESPIAYTKTKSLGEKLGYIAISGLITHKWLHSGEEAAMAQIMEGHGIDQYIAALANLVSPPGRFSPDGEWLSKGSFFDVSSNEVHFRFCRNGHFKVINDFKFFEIVRQTTNDSGTWEYNAPDLHMIIPGLARMTYRLKKGDGDHVAVWERVSMKSDMNSPATDASPGGKLAAAALDLILHRMEGKTIDWQRTPPTPDQPLYPAP
ncbi:MAG: hypothetical protein ABI600_04545 [Luteolibacter sp.]